MGAHKKQHLSKEAVCTVNLKPMQTCTSSYINYRHQNLSLYMFNSTHAIGKNRSYLLL